MTIQREGNARIMTILELLIEAGLKPTHGKTRNGEKYESPCPICKGTNRFQLFLNQDGSEVFICRKCGRKGGIIQYLEYYKGMTKEEAYLHAGISYKRFFRRREIPEIHTDSPTPKQSPPQQWQDQANVFLKWSEECLWRKEYINIRSWLNKERGLSDETIRKVRLGWLPQDWYSDIKLWGFADKINETDAKDKIWIPAGLVIPCFHDGQLHRIRIRRHNPHDGGRYYLIQGSSMVPMVIGTEKTIVIVESELDAILLSQEAGYLASVIALGSADIRPHIAIKDPLANANKILVSLDSDEAGAMASLKWWLGQFPNAVRWPVVKGKDPTEAFLNGLNLSNWVLAGMKHERKMLALSKTAEDHTTQDFILLNNRASLSEYLEKFKSAKEIAVSVMTLEQKQYLFLSLPDEPVIALDISNPDQQAITPLKEILEGPAERVFYDAKSGLKTLYSAGLNVNGNIFDIMLAVQIINAGIEDLDYSLQHLFKNYQSKDIGKGNNLTTEVILKQTANETKRLFKLRDILFKKLEITDLIDTAILEFACIRSTVQMELNGLCIDIEKVNSAREKYLRLRAEYKNVLTKELGAINFESHDQLIDALCSRNINTENTKSETLIPLCDKYPVLGTLINYRQTSYDLNLAENLISYFNPETGRLYPQYNQIGTPTGRFSSFNPNIHGIKRGEFRSFFIASPGHKLVIADYSQIELRIAAEISGDQKMIGAYKNGYDLHKLTASILTGKPLDQVSKDERQAAKAVNFGLIYAMGAKGLMEYAWNKYGIFLTLEQAQLFKTKFFRFYKGIDKWHNNLARSLQPGVSESRTMGGRWRIMIDRVTKMFNSPVQGTSADITKKALCLLSERLTGTGVKIIGCIHDEIILEAPERDSDELKDILRSTMKEAGESYLKSVPVEVEVSVTDNWMEK